MDDEIVLCRKLGERAHVIGQIDGCRAGKAAACGHVGVDVVRLNVYAVAIGLLTQLDIERQNGNIEAADQLRAEVAGAVSGDFIVHTEILSLCASGAGCGKIR